jgi:hypothetical protein
VVTWIIYVGNGCAISFPDEAWLNYLAFPAPAELGLNLLLNTGNGDVWGKSRAKTGFEARSHPWDRRAVY